MDPAAERALRSLPLFASLGDREMQGLAARCSLVSLNPSQTLFSEGEKGSDLFVVISGTLRIACKGPDGTSVEVGQVDEGGLVGEMAVLESSSRSATVSSSGGSTVLRLPSDSFLWLVAEGHPAAATILRHIRKQVCQRLRALDERLDGLYYKPAGAAAGTDGAPSLIERLRLLLKALWPGG